jgi:hypothetical protein
MQDQNTKRTVHIVGNYNDYGAMFFANGWIIVDNVEDADLVQFCGGEDVNPAMYNERSHLTTHSNPDRDTYEARIFELAFEQNKAIAGICRGAQFVHVMNGGKLYQDVNNHGVHGTHYGTIVPDDLLHLAPSGFQMSSTHHQMMREDIGRVIVSAKLSNRKELDTGPIVITREERDIESMYYSTTSSLSYQPHPEFFSKGHPCQAVYFGLIEELLFCGEDG